MITVNEAIRKGQRMINLPISIVMIVVSSILIFLDKENMIPTWLILAGLLFVFLCSWLYWSLSITQWRLWAFKNVDDPYELRRRAVAERLIWEKGSVFEKTEIRTAAEKQQWKTILKTRFGEEEPE